MALSRNTPVTNTRRVRRKLHLSLESGVPHRGLPKLGTLPDSPPLGTSKYTLNERPARTTTLPVRPGLRPTAPLCDATSLQERLPSSSTWSPKSAFQSAFLSLSSPRASTYTSWKRLPCPFDWIPTRCCISFLPALNSSPPFSGLSSPHSSLCEPFAFGFCDGSEQFNTVP